MITVHHLEHSRSQRILWLLEELALPYEVVRYARDAKTLLAPSSLKQVHPLGKSPVITDGEHTIAETGAIIEYLIAKADGALRPAPTSEAYWRYVYYLHYAEGSLMPLLVMKLVFSRLGQAPMPLPLRPIGRLIASGVGRQYLEPNIADHLTFLNAELSRHTWFAGPEFSAADVIMSFPLQAAAGASASGLAAYSRLADFVRRIEARPAYERALERGGPFHLPGRD